MAATHKISFKNTQKAKPAAQLQLLQSEPKSYGGELLKTRAGRSRPRPLSTNQTMHLVLRSSKAREAWSFAGSHNRKVIKNLIRKFSIRYGVRTLSFANVGNHLHLHIQLKNRHSYPPFIRGLTAAIAMAVTGVSRWKKWPELVNSFHKYPRRFQFWDYRPYTRIVVGNNASLRLRDYIRINVLEGFSIPRKTATHIVRMGQFAKHIGPLRAKWDSG